MMLPMCLAAMTAVIILPQWFPVVLGDCPAVVAGSCSNGWKHWQRGCYIANTNKNTFDEANQFCAGMGAVMAAPRSTSENQFLAEFMKNETSAAKASWVNCEKPNTTISTPTSCNCYGDDHKVFNFTPTWVDGDPTGEACIILHLDTVNYTWTDTRCSSERVSACKRPSSQLHF